MSGKSQTVTIVFNHILVTFKDTFIRRHKGKVKGFNHILIYVNNENISKPLK